MTLILGLMTPEFVVLCSDRRVTTLGSNNQVQDQRDAVGKTFNLAGRSLAGFTGPIRPGELLMEPLVAEMLCAVPPTLHWEVLAARLDEEFRHEKIPNIPFSMLGVGFRETPEGLVPGWWLASNTCDEDGNVGPEHVNGSFRLVQQPVDGVEIRDVGYPVDDLLKEWTVNTVRASIGTDPSNPLPAIEALLDLHRITAQGSDDWVGTAVLVTVLPRAAFGAEQQVSPMGGITPEMWGSQVLGLFLPDLTGGMPPQIFFPAFIGSGVTMTGISFDPSGTVPKYNPDGWIRKFPRPCIYP